MSDQIQMIFTFVVMFITIILLVSNKVRPDLVALSSLLILFIFGIITGPEALAGFANSTVILVASLFVVADGLTRTGVSSWLGNTLMTRRGSKERDVMLMMLITTSIMGAVISNNGTVAIMVPIVVSAAWKVDSKPSKFLMPMAIISNFSGLLMLISNNTNIIISNTLVEAGYPPFGFFEFILIGLPLLIIAIIYLLYFSKKFLPETSGMERPLDLEKFLGDLSSSYSLEGNLFWLRIRKDSNLVGRKLSDVKFIKENRVNILNVHHIVSEQTVTQEKSTKERRKDDFSVGLISKEEFQNAYGKMWERLSIKKKKSIQHLIPERDFVFQPNDMVLVLSDQKVIQEMVVRYNLGLQPLGGTKDQLTGTLVNQEVGLAEILITPRSSYIGQEIGEGNLFGKYEVQILRISRQSKPIEEKSVRLKNGDSLLIRGTWKDISEVQSNSRNYIVVGKPGEMASQIFEINKQVIISIASLILMVVLMAVGALPPEFAALLAAVIMVAGRCLTMEQAYRSITWYILIIIAGLIPLATALEKTGGVELLANILIVGLGWNPFVLLAGVFVLASLLTQVISNTITTILLSPIIITAASTLGWSPYPFMMMLAIAVITGFLTPIGTPTMLMVMTPGGYKYKDYMKLGIPLWVIVFVVSMLLVPLFWPFF